MKRTWLLWIFTLVLVVNGFHCQSDKKSESLPMDGKSFTKGTFGYDAAFLQDHAQAVVLKDSDGKAMVIVSPKLQGKVFTSTADGLEGQSYGWINYDLINSGEIREHMNGYGGEDRLWIGPEGGQFSVFFKQGSEMTLENWFTPPPIDTEPFELLEKSATTVIMQKNMTLINYAGTKFSLRIDRTVELMSAEAIASRLGLTLTESIRTVAFVSANDLTNLGEAAWTEESGTVCIWILGMFRPSANGLVVVPYVEGETGALGPVATTDYFGEVPSDRIQIGDGKIIFKADGKHRSKIGVSALRAKNVAGSYDPDQNMLTVIQYTLPASPAKYVNQLWEIQEKPFAGDVVNSYNDGPLADGSQMGPFYELESCSPAAFLNPGEKLTHTHTTYHFIGKRADLDPISRQVLGLGIDEIILR